MPSEKWMELSEAARILGVHQSTLRRWADSGKIPHIRTLSGRRRFHPSAIEQARGEMQPTASALQSQVADQIETSTRNFAHSQAGQFSSQEGGWLSQLSQEQILLFRYSGQRLLGLMMQYISRSSGADTFLEEAKHVAGDYGLICYRAGFSISQTADAFLHFRRSILESMQATTGLNGPHDKDGHRIFLRTSDFFDTLLVATIDNYAKLSQAK